MVFRRRSSGAPDVLDQDPAPTAIPGSADAHQGARDERRQREADPQAQRGGAPPQAALYRAADRKGAVKQSKETERATRARRYAAAKRGEDWALPRKDQGPVRALARDYVDSRRRISEYYMYAVGALVILLFVPGLRVYADYLVLAVIVVMVTEGLLVGRQVLKLARQRFPGESTRGLRMYSAIRSTQIRKLRMPAPRVSPGGRF